MQKTLGNLRQSGNTITENSDSSNDRLDYLQQQQIQREGRPPETITTGDKRRPSTEQEWAETVAAIRGDPFLLTDEEAGTWDSSDDDDNLLDSSDDEEVEETPQRKRSQLQPNAERTQEQQQSMLQELRDMMQRQRTRN